MTMKRNPNYWKEGRAHFDNVVLLAIADVTARQNALVTGEIDAMNRVDLKTAHLLGKKDGITIEEVTGTQHYTIPMNTTVAPFDNYDVRMALKLAIDREALVNSLAETVSVATKNGPGNGSGAEAADAAVAEAAE